MGHLNPSIPLPVPCRVLCENDRHGWVVASSCQPPFVIAVKMDDTEFFETYAADAVQEVK